jgi:hypothetical protein
MPATELNHELVDPGTGRDLCHVCFLFNLAVKLSFTKGCDTVHRVDTSTVGLMMSL